jgi:hypothetical protein
MQAEEAQSFYARKIEQCRTQVEFVKEQLKLYLQTNNQKSLATPDGTFFLKRNTERKWGDEKELVDWAKKVFPEAVKTTETCNRTVLLKHLKETGEVPPSYEENTVTTLQVRE